MTGCRRPAPCAVWRYCRTVRWLCGAGIRRRGEYVRRFGDRDDGHLLRSLFCIFAVSPYLMKTRNIAQNYIRDAVEIAEQNRISHRSGRRGWSTSACCTCGWRSMCERTCARDREIEVNMTVKKEMSPDTVIKLRFDPSDTADVVYQRFNAKVQEVKNVLEDTSFGALAGAFHLAPGLLLKFLVWALQVSDYFGCLPGSITHLSHFHGSLYITFMASLGIPPIFHRLYDFGNVPVFWSFGRKRQAFEYQWDGTVARRR